MPSRYSSNRFSDFTTRLGGRGANAWGIHTRALAAREAGEDVIVLSVGDPEFDTPRAAVDAAKAALDAGDTRYTDMRGRHALRALIAERHTRRTGQDVTADNVVVVPGAQAGLFCASMCLAGPGDEVVTTDPVYTTYEATIHASGATGVAVPLDSAAGFRIDTERLIAAVGARTRAIFLANPNNPTGTVLSVSETQLIADLATRHDAWIVADEVYADLVFDEPFRPFAALPEIRNRLVSISSLSKSHAMTGWRLGWMVVPADLSPHLENLMLCMLYGMPGFIQAAAITALEQGEADVAAMRSAYRRRRDLVIDRLDACPVIQCTRPDAGMFLLLDVTRTGLAGADFVERLFAGYRVSLLDATAFGDCGTGFVRLSLAACDSRLDEGCRRIIEFATTLEQASRQAG